MSDSSGKVLALYDFASKQEYIYRTSKIKEISGASSLLDGMYKSFCNVLNENGFIIYYDLEKPFKMEEFDSDNSACAEVLYDGGGNLMVLFKSEEAYIKANRIISVYLLKAAPGLTMIACCVDYTGKFEFDRSKLYQKNSQRKNRFPAYDMPAVSPVTQIDPMTFLPVTYKRDKGKSYVYPESEVSISSDRFSKVSAYNGKSKDFDGMTAVIYIDGNSMGKKLESCKSDDYEEGIAKLRNFSKQVNDIYVLNPLKSMKEIADFRKIIGGGDEITVICEAKDALKLVKKYFEDIQKKCIELSGQTFNCTSCAGIAVFHAKSPFNVAYNIAEAACESAKGRAHKNDGNYLDFYYCHAGITNSFEILREREQKHAVGRPYSFDEICGKRFSNTVKILRNAGRANAKNLGNAVQSSKEKYLLETKRVNAYLPNESEMLTGSIDEMKMVYDISEFYDLWFGKEENVNEKSS